MASEHGEPTQPEPEEPEPGKPQGEVHVSFVQRLHRHFGTGVDPRIDLQNEDDGASRPREPGSRTPTSVEEFVKRLSPTLEGGGRYEIKQDVASGGMGTIYRVWDADLRRNLAMKVMHGRKSPVTEGPAAHRSTPSAWGASWRRPRSPASSITRASSRSTISASTPAASATSRCASCAGAS